MSPFGITRVAATYRREILRTKTGAEVAENGVLDGFLVDLDANGRRVVEEGTVLVYAGTPELVTVTVTADDWTLTFGAQTTSALDEEATAAQVEAALIALSTIDADEIRVTGEDGGPYTLKFVGALGDENVGAVTASGATIAVARQGAAPVAGAGQKLKPAGAGIAAADVAGVLMTTIELWPGEDGTGAMPQETADKPVAVYTKNCHFNVADLTGYAGNETAVKTAMTGAGTGRLANCTFE